ncbi:hypothetical protein V8C86DRAFT_1805071, partial [Haematococcus lacustris]
MAPFSSVRSICQFALAAPTDLSMSYAICLLPLNTSACNLQPIGLMHKLNITMTSSRHIVMAKAMYTLSSPLLPHISHLTCNHKC